MVMKTETEGAEKGGKEGRESDGRKLVGGEGETGEKEKADR